jgi:hypothetical protein
LKKKKGQPQKAAKKTSCAPLCPSFKSEQEKERQQKSQLGVICVVSFCLFTFEIDEHQKKIPNTSFNPHFYILIS